MSDTRDRLKRIEEGIQTTETYLRELQAERHRTLKEAKQEEASRPDGRHAWQPVPYQKVVFGKKHGSRQYTYVAVYSVGRWYVSQDGYGMGRMRGLTHSQFIEFVGKDNSINILDAVSVVRNTPDHRSDQGYSIDVAQPW